VTYKLKAGESIVGGVLYGWTGAQCSDCRGHGEVFDKKAGVDTVCKGCGGTGDEYGRMPVQPSDLPARVEPI
jgi:DnaJ-class molecular chaperone